MASFFACTRPCSLSQYFLYTPHLRRNHEREKTIEVCLQVTAERFPRSSFCQPYNSCEVETLGKLVGQLFLSHRSRLFLRRLQFSFLRSLFFELASYCYNNNAFTHTHTRTKKHPKQLKEAIYALKTEAWCAFNSFFLFILYRQV